jgi:DNA invertase Pin-like site-specific DNA recombinase
MQRAALYVRMSTDKQEHSAENQIQVLTQYANRGKYEIVRTYADEGISGTNAEKRPAFMRMIDDSAAGLFDVVLIYDSSRFARNLKESLIYKAELKKNGVALVSITEPNLDDDSALLVDAILGASNELYSRKLSKAVIRGMVYYAEHGNFTGTPPYGYRKKDGVTTIDEREAENVRRVFELFVAHPSWYYVAVQMNEQGHRTRYGAAWGSRDIKRMLTNPAYVGKVRYRGETYSGIHTAIVSDELWTASREAISNKPRLYRARPESGVKHWLSGVVRCGRCGGAMTYITYHNGGKISNYFRCHANANGKCPVSNMTAAKTIEGIALAALESIIGADTLADADIETIPAPQAATNTDAVQMAIKQARARLSRHKEAYAAGIDSLVEYKANREKCERDIGELENRLAEADSSEPREALFEPFKNKVISLLSVLDDKRVALADKNMAVKRVIQRIVVDRKSDKIRVIYYY